MQPDRQCWRGLLFDEIEEYEEYIAAATILVEKDTSNYVVLNNRGLAHLEIGNWSEAETDLKAACAINHKEPIPELNLVDLLLKQGKPQESLHVASRAVQMAPKDYSCYAVRATVYRQLGQVPEAEKDEFAVQTLRKT